MSCITTRAIDTANIERMLPEAPKGVKTEIVIWNHRISLKVYHEDLPNKAVFYTHGIRQSFTGNWQRESNKRPARNVEMRDLSKYTVAWKYHREIKKQVLDEAIELAEAQR